MTPESFHTLYDAATDSPPPTNLMQSSVAAGRRRLVRRRLAVTGAGFAALAVVAGSAYAGSGLTEDSPDTQVATPSGARMSDAEVIEKCRTLDGNTKEAVDGLFAPGRPTVEVRTGTTERATFVLMAADSETWAECSFPRAGSTAASGLRLYITRGFSSRAGEAVGSGCPLVDDRVDPSCRSFAVRVTDKLPEAVAAVEFRTGDGKTSVAERRPDGYLFFDYVGRLPDGVPAVPSEWGDFRALERVTYLNAEGDPIAAGTMDGSDNSTKDRRVDGLPRLDKYFSIKSNVEPGLLDEVR